MNEVVIVDDDELTLKLVKRLLGNCGLNLRLFSDEIRALEYLRLHAPRILLVDQRMPRMDGLELLQELTSSPDIASTRTFLCSTVKVPEHIRIAAEAVGAQTLTKDIYTNRAELLQLLHDPEQLAPR